MKIHGSEPWHIELFFLIFFIKQSVVFQVMDIDYGSIDSFFPKKATSDSMKKCLWNDSYLVQREQI